MIWGGGLVCMMPVEGRLVGRTCTIGNTVTPPWTSLAYVLVTNEGHAVSQLSGLDANQFLWCWISQKRYEVHSFNEMPTSFKVAPFFDAEYLRNGTRYIVSNFQWNANRDLHTLYSTVLFWMTLSGLGWLIKIFNDRKRRAVSLR